MNSFLQSIFKCEESGDSAKIPNKRQQILSKFPFSSMHYLHAKIVSLQRRA